MAAIILAYFKVTSVSEWVFEITIGVSATAMGAFVVDLSLFSSISTTVSGRVMMVVGKGTWYSLAAFLILFLGACLYKSQSRSGFWMRPPPPPPKDRAAEEGRNAGLPPPSLPLPEKDQTCLIDFDEEYKSLLGQMVVTEEKLAKTPLGPKRFSKKLPPIPTQPQEQYTTDAPKAESEPIALPQPSMKTTSRRTTRNLESDSKIINSTLDYSRLSVEESSNTAHSFQMSLYFNQPPPSTYAPSSYSAHRRMSSSSSAPIPFTMEQIQMYGNPALASSSCLYSPGGSSRRKSALLSSRGSSGFYIQMFTNPARASSSFMHSPSTSEGRKSTRLPSRRSTQESPNRMNTNSLQSSLSKNTCMFS